MTESYVGCGVATAWHGRTSRCPRL